MIHQPDRSYICIAGKKDSIIDDFGIQICVIKADIIRMFLSWKRFERYLLNLALSREIRRQDVSTRTFC